MAVKIGLAHCRAPVYLATVVADDVSVIASISQLLDFIFDLPKKIRIFRIKLDPLYGTRRSLESTPEHFPESPLPQYFSRRIN